MLAFRVIFCLALVLIPMSALGQCGGEDEVGSTRTFTCTTDRTCHPNPIFQWTAISDTYLISHCDSTLDCTGNKEYFTITIRQDEDGSYESILTIKSLSITEPFDSDGDWVCYACGSRALTCDVNPYVKPVNPQCMLEEVLDDDGDITGIELRCEVETVYPSAVCRFQTVASNNTRQDLPSQPSGSDLCFLSLGIEDVGQVGENKFAAIVTADGQPDTDVAPTPVTPYVYLSLPRTIIDCPGYEYKAGYYRGTSIVCDCFITSVGKPYGQPGWYRDDIRLIQGDVSTQYTFDINLLSQYPNSNYTCAGESPLGRESPPNSFPLKFAYLTSADLRLTDDGQIVNLCCNSSGYLAQCTFPESGIHPTPRFIFSLNDQIYTHDSPVSVVGDLYQAQSYLKPKVGGIYFIGCRVENTIFPNMSAETGFNKTFYSPPQLAQAFDYKDVYDVPLGSTSEAMIEIEVTAYPQQITFDFNTRDLNSSVACKNCTVTYMNTLENSGIFQITFTNISESDLVRYWLTVDNNVGSSLEYSFTLRETSDGDDNLWLIVGVAVAGAVIIIIIVLLVVWRCRKKQKEAANEPEEQAKASVKGKKKASVKETGEYDDNIYNEPDDKDEEEYVYRQDSVTEQGQNKNFTLKAGKQAKIPQKQFNMPKIIKTTDVTAESSSFPKPPKPKKTETGRAIDPDAQKVKGQKAAKAKSVTQNAVEDNKPGGKAQVKPKAKGGKGKKSALEEPWYVNIPNSKKPKQAVIVGNATEIRVAGGSVEDVAFSSQESVLY